jgi:hypothetical protein
MYLSMIAKNYAVSEIGFIILNEEGASLAEWLRLLTSYHLSDTAVGSDLPRDFGFIHMRKLSR